MLLTADQTWNFLKFMIELIMGLIVFCFSWLDVLYRLIYRSRQRGYLELDLILGKWVEEHIHSMDENGIKSLVDVLNLVKNYLLLCFGLFFSKI